MGAPHCKHDFALLCASLSCLEWGFFVFLEKFRKSFGGGNMKKGVSKLKVSLMAALATTAFMATSASANVSKALNQAGISDTGSTDGLFDDLQKVVYLIMGLGGLWGVACIVVGAILLSGSAGNPQKRSAGMGALGFAIAGIFVIYKAYDIAGWATGIGG